MDSHHLKSFIAVAEQQSMTLAAEKLFITQPAMSKRIKFLENELDCLLFTREKRTLQLTTEGHLLLPKAYKILSEIENSKVQIQNLKKTTSGNLHIATSHHIGIHRLPPLLKNYKSRFPKVDLRLQFLESENAMALLNNGKAECALITLPNHISSAYEFKTLWQDDLFLCFSPQHELANSKKISLHDLSDYSAILPSSKSFTRELIDHFFYEQNIQINTTMESNYLETIKMMVDVGLGWSFLPDNLIEKDWLKIPTQTIFKRKLGIIRFKKATPSNAAQQFWNINV